MYYLCYEFSVSVYGEFMISIGAVLDPNRPFRFATYNEENVIRPLVSRIVAKTKQFVPENDSYYFASSGSKIPVAVKRNLAILDKLGMDEHSTIGQFLKTVRTQAKKCDLSWLVQNKI